MADRFVNIRSAPEAFRFGTESIPTLSPGLEGAFDWYFGSQDSSRWPLCRVGTGSGLVWRGRRRRGLEAVALRGESVIQTLYANVRPFFGETIPNLQMSWVKLGSEKAVEMLRRGCNDSGEALDEESITRESGGEWGMSGHG